MPEERVNLIEALHSLCLRENSTWYSVNMYNVPVFICPSDKEKKMTIESLILALHTSDVIVCLTCVHSQSLTAPITMVTIILISIISNIIIIVVAVIILSKIKWL